MDFILFPPIELPDHISIPAVVKISHWDTKFITQVPDKGVDYIEFDLVQNETIVGEKLLFFISPVIPLIPVMEAIVKIGLPGTLTFHKKFLPFVIGGEAKLEYRAEIPAVAQPPAELPQEDMAIDPIVALCIDLENYAIGGFKTFGEFKERLATIKHIDINQYANLVEEAADAMFKKLTNDQKKFANILVKEVKGIMK